LDSAKYESKFPYWTHLHGFWQTLPNFNPQPLSSDCGQEIGDEMKEFITDRANSEATGANVTGNISRGNVEVSDPFHVCHNISDQHSQGGKLDAIMAGPSDPVSSSLVLSCIMTPHSGISSTRPKRKHNADVTKTLADIDMTNAGLAEKRLLLRLAEMDVKKMKLVNKHKVMMAQIGLQWMQLEASIVIAMYRCFDVVAVNGKKQKSPED